jgi:hypothetical protein
LTPFLGHSELSFGHSDTRHVIIVSTSNKILGLESGVCSLRCNILIALDPLVLFEYISEQRKGNAKGGAYFLVLFMILILDWPKVPVGVRLFWIFRMFLTLR